MGKRRGQDEALVIKGDDMLRELVEEQAAAQAGGVGAALEEGPQQPCTLSGLTAALSGGALGAVFGLGGALLQPKAGFGWKRLSGAAGASAKDFALWGGAYTLVACIMQRVRLREDAINSGVAGAVTGFTMSLRSGLVGALQSAALIGALSFVADHYGKQSAQAAALPGPQISFGSLLDVSAVPERCMNGKHGPEGANGRAQGGPAARPTATRDVLHRLRGSAKQGKAGANGGEGRNGRDTQSQPLHSKLGLEEEGVRDAEEGEGHGQGDQLRRARRQLLIWRLAAYALLLAVIALAIFGGIMCRQRQWLQQQYTHLTNATAYQEANSCPAFGDAGQATLQKDRRPSTQTPLLFEELSADEMMSVRQFLFAQKDYNLSKAGLAPVPANTIYLMELLPPPKAEAVAYLDGQGRYPAPPRLARVVLYAGYSDPPKVVELGVGPLPNPKNVSLLREVEWNARPPNQVEYGTMDAIISDATAVLQPLMEASFGNFTYDSCLIPKCLVWRDSTPRGVAMDSRQTWVGFNRFTEGFALHPVPLELLVDHGGNDPRAWRVSRVHYGGQLWQNATALMDAYYTADFNRVKVHTPQPEEPRYATNRRAGGLVSPLDPQALANAPGRPKLKQRGAEAQAGPRQYEPSGKRFTIDRNNVTYMGWTFQVGVRSTGGLVVWDVRFKGERIAYEISLQEAMLSRGGITPTEALGRNLDTATGLGTSFHELVHGFDCPHTAAYLDHTVFWDQDTPTAHPQSLCLWEQDTGNLLRRHYTQEYTAKGSLLQYAGLQDYALTLRGITTVFNADYVVDLAFHLNGAIEVSVTPGGSALGAMWSGATANFSYPFYTDVGANVQDIFFNWKVDLDIAGSANSVLLERIDTERVAQPFSQRGRDLASPGQAITWQKVVRRELPEVEEEAVAGADPMRPAQTVIVNERSLNQWGSPQGYRIQVDRSVAQLLPESWRDVPRGHWSRSPIATTVRHENETASSSIYAAAHPGAPQQPVNFSAFANGESVRGADLVSWVTVGMFDLPTSEAAPLLSNTGRRLGFWLQPHNYFDQDAGTDLYGMLIMVPSNYTRQAAPIINRQGVAGNFTCAPPDTQVPFDRAELANAG